MEEIRLNTIFGDLYNKIKNALFITMLQSRVSMQISYIATDIFGIELSAGATMCNFKIKDRYNVFLVADDIERPIAKEILIDNEIGLLIVYPDILTCNETPLSDIINNVAAIIEKIAYFMRRNGTIIKADKLIKNLPNIFTMYMVLYFYNASNRDFPWYKDNKEYYDKVMKYSIEDLFDNMKILSL